MNKKVLGIGVLAALFFLNKKTDTPTGNTTNTGTSGSLPTGAGGVVDPCSASFLFNNIKVCEDLLPNYGFFWWSGPDGAGWYNYNQFMSSKGGAQIVVNSVSMTFENAIIAWSNTIIDTGNSNYTDSMNQLRNYYTGGGPLPTA